LEKLSAILKNSPNANVTVIGRTVLAEIYALANQHAGVAIEERYFKLWDLWDKDLVLLATDNRQLHESIRKFARSRKILINVADTPDLCDFYLGSVVTKGNLKVGISTNGKSPTIAKRFREYLEEALPDNTNDLLNNMQQIREHIKGDFGYKVKVLNEITTQWLENPVNKG
jgi:precorrin-2 dehydrogenase/sirohydrochlorin ferrochelatase